MVRTQGSAYIYLFVPKKRANLGPKNFDYSYVKTCSKTHQNICGRVITWPNAFLDRTGSEVSGWVGVDFGARPAKTGQTGQTVHVRSPFALVTIGSNSNYVNSRL